MAVTTRESQQMRRPWYRPSLTVQIMIGLVVGGVIGWLRPDWGNAVYFFRDIFINLIKSIIAPLVFSTIVVGIAGAGALRKVGRMGAKALIYFEIVTTAALFIGLAVVNFTKPGIGVTLAATNTNIIKTIEQSHPKTLVETIVHAFPSSVVEAMVRGDVLQIVIFSVLFALAVSAIGEKGKPIVRAMESLAQIMFKFTNYVMLFAPIGVGAAMAHTIGTQGPGVLLNLGKLIGSLYLALVIFILLIFGLGDLDRADSVAAIRQGCARARDACIRDYKQRIGFAKSDGIDGAVRSAATYRWLCHAHWIFVQSGRFDALSRACIRVCGASRRNDHGLAHGVWSTDCDGPHSDTHFQRSGRGAARVVGYFASDGEQFFARRSWPDRSGGYFRSGRIDGYGPDLRECDRQLSGDSGGRTMGGRIRRCTRASVWHTSRSGVVFKIRRSRFCRCSGPG